jgi:histone-binding protein RBBP4
LFNCLEKNRAILLTSNFYPLLLSFFFYIADDLEDKRITEEYKIWKKNTPFLYDVVLTHLLEWNSLTVQWLPEKRPVLDGDYNEHKLILGTHAAEGEKNSLLIAKVLLPGEDTEIDARKYDEVKNELGGYGGSKAKIEIDIRINHEGEVNRARYCPQNSFLIATKTPSGEVHVFDYSKHGSKPTDSLVKPIVKCKGHSKEGYGLDWNPVEQGRLLSGADDKFICVWDVLANSSSLSPQTELQPLFRIAHHTKVVEDVSWHRQHKDIFASVGDDRLLCLWDARVASSGAPRLSVVAHAGDAMSVSFNPFSEFLLLTGGTDKLVKMWDTRDLSQPVHTFEGHEDDVTGVQWAPFNEAMLASSSADRRINIWDASLIGTEQEGDDAADGPPELLFVHGGHTAKISDFSWNSTDDFYIASVAEDNILQVWHMNQDMVFESGGSGAGVANAASAAGAAGDGKIELE